MSEQVTIVKYTSYSYERLVTITKGTGDLTLKKLSQYFIQAFSHLGNSFVHVCTPQKCEHSVVIR